MEFSEPICLTVSLNQFIINTKPTNFPPLGKLVANLLLLPLLLMAACSDLNNGLKHKNIDIKNPEAPAPYSREVVTRKIDTSSFYLTMTDGTEIAVDLHLPRGVNQPLPTIIHQTRYWRSVGIRFPFNIFIDGNYIIWGDYRRHFVQHGYAWIDVDVRGTGASFGIWKHSYWSKEVADGKDIVDWIISQSWSNGKVGSWGISYAGGSAEFLLTNRHPAVKAAAPMYSPFDVYDDIALPGGIKSIWYINAWNKGNQTLDANKIPVKSFFANIAATGVKTVDGSENRVKLNAALKSRTDNFDVATEAKYITYRDDSSPSMSSIDQMSPHSFAKQIDSSGAAIYSYSGWFDGAYQHAAIKRYLTYSNPNNKLIIGPWDHSGGHNVNLISNTVERFEHANELLKFFDTYLMDIPTGINNEPPIHYFVMNEDRWHSTQQWPPKNTEKKQWFLSVNNELLGQHLKSSVSYDTYRIDFSLGTDTKSRWTALTNPTEDGVMYPNWHTDDYLNYTTEPFNSNTIIVGHPTIKLYISTSEQDVALHVYLSDVDTLGNPRYVTEGLLRARHRHSIDRTPAHQDVVPVRSYIESKSTPLTPDLIELLEFDLLPTAYQFKKGHSLRISIAAADKTYFESVGTNGSEIKIIRDPLHPSVLSVDIQSL